MLCLEIRKSPGPSWSPKKFPPHWPWPMTSEQSNSIFVSSANSGTRRSKPFHDPRTLYLGMGGLRIWLAMKGHCKEIVNIFFTKKKKINLRVKSHIAFLNAALRQGKEPQHCPPMHFSYCVPLLSFMYLFIYFKIYFIAPLLISDTIVK